MILSQQDFQPINEYGSDDVDGNGVRFVYSVTGLIASFKGTQTTHDYPNGALGLQGEGAASHFQGGAA